jgi:hypothetical protein
MVLKSSNGKECENRRYSHSAGRQKNETEKIRVREKRARKREERYECRREEEKRKWLICGWRARGKAGDDHRTGVPTKAQLFLLFSYTHMATQAIE